MKRIFLAICLLPLIALAQNGKSKAVTKPTTKTKTKVDVVKPAADGFVISGTVKGLPDGSSVALLNPQTGAIEVETTSAQEKFTLKGKLAAPDFKLLTFLKQPPYTYIFLDNSNVTVSGNKEQLDQLTVTGSATHKDYQEFSSLIAPYQSAFSENAPFDSATNATALSICYNFAVKHNTSFINPLAIFRYSQLSEDMVQTENLYNQLNSDVKSSPMGVAVMQYITETKRNALGTLLPDFTQADTAGKPVSLSSLRGKYVLVDFWASWCGPCRQENPNVVAAYNKYKDKNFTVLGVSLDRSKNPWLDAIKMDGLTWTHVSDLQGWQNAVAQQNNITQIPQNFLIDPQGKIIGKNLRGIALEKKLEKLLH